MTAPFRPARRLVAVGFVACVLAAAAEAAPPHEEVEKRIAELTAALRDDPEDATLYLQRAEMLRHHERWDEAFADLERAAALRPDLPGLAMTSSRVAGDAGHLPLALQLVERQLDETPDSPGALRQRAKILQGLQRWEEAAAAWHRAIAHDPAPHPEDFVARAEATLAIPVAEVGEPVASGRRQARENARAALALHGLDEGIRQLGDVVTLQLKAAELEQRLGRHASALDRIDRLAAKAARKDPWLERRGDVLAAAGRADEARAAWRSALDALRRLPPAHRETGASKERHDRLLRKITPQVTEGAPPPDDLPEDSR